MRTCVLVIFYISLGAIVSCGDGADGGSNQANRPDNSGEEEGDRLVVSRCATEHPTAQEQRDFERGANLRFPGGIRKSILIPVAFHIITGADNSGQVSDEMVAKQLGILNSAFAQCTVSESSIRFVHKSTDRTVSEAWFHMSPGSDAEELSKKRLAIETSSTLNVYTANLVGADKGTLLGWAYFPWRLPEGSPHLDGVVVHFGSMPGGKFADYNLGATAIHEVGHYLGLYHTFQNGCSEPDDNVADTPRHLLNSGCPEIAPDTCPDDRGLDPISNYLNYTTDKCMDAFSNGQAIRMFGVCAKYRPKFMVD